MASTTTFESSSPSPPSTAPNSPPRTLRKVKRKSDPFLELPNVSTGDSNNDQIGEKEGNGDTEQNESPLTKIIMAPLIFTSFILSLFIVNHRYRTWRLSEHPPVHSTFWSRVSLRSWLDPEPYQNPSNATWEHAPDSKGQVPHPQSEKWFTRKKHRKVARMEISDAFDLSGKVMIFVGIVLVFGVLGVGWAARQAYHTVFG